MQTKPLRSYGIDVTQQTLQPILESLGIDDRTVKQMTQAEKEILRYIATLKQGQIAMGDLANTIESPSNQLKVFRQQLVETKVAISSLFMGTFAYVLPYFNAFLMVIKEISKAIADMFGIELRDYNSGIASNEDAYAGIADSADSATESVKELKRQTLGFDQINNINENKDSGNDGSNLVGGIDQRLLDAIEGYDNGMESVRMKATQIRDSIMEWLGFTKEIDPLTGEVSFKYEGIDKTLSNFWNWFKKLNTQGKIFVGLGIVAVVSKLFSGVKKLTSVLGSSGLFKAVKNLLSPMSDLVQNISLFTTAAGARGLTGINKLTEGVKRGTQAWKDNLTAMDRVKTMLVGATGLVIGFGLVGDAMENVSNEGWSLGNSLQTVVGGLSSIAGGALIGSAFGTWGSIIGGAVGAVGTLISALQGYETEIDKINEYNTTLMTQFDEIETKYNEMEFSTDVHQALFDELDALVESNGKVKEGYEERAQFIITTLNNAYGLEIEMIDGVIQQYSKQKQAIQEVINKKKTEIATNMAVEKYELALKEQTNAYNNLTKAQKDYNDAQKEVETFEKRLKKAWEESSEARKKQYNSYEAFVKAMTEDDYKYQKAIKNEQEMKKALDESQKSYDATQEAIMIYNGIITASAQDNSEQVEYYTNVLLNSHDKQNRSYKESMEEAKASYESQLRIAKDKGQEITDTIIQQAETRYREQASILANEIKHVEEITPDYVEAWGILAENSENTFLTYFKKLPEDVQQEVVNQMYSKGYSISNELQKGINQINPTIKVTADTSSAEKKIIAFFNNNEKTFQEWFGGKGSSRAKGGAYYAGSWHDVAQYANGGAPSHGTAFVAGERGPEIVGHINGRTEVLNQSQLASVMYSAVVAGMSQFGGQTNEIDVHVHTDEGTVIDRVNQKIKQTGTFPFIMPTR